MSAASALRGSDMKVERYGDIIIKLWLTAEDTHDWANRPGAAWPCSELAGKELFAEFHNGDLVDFTVDGKDQIDVGCEEINAVTSDFLE
jgi:hypothetical protein